MAILPSSILKHLTAKAIDNTEALKSIPNANIDGSVLIQAHNNTGNYYLFYKDAIRAFLMAGYPEKKAIAYIDKWVDYDLVNIRYIDEYKMIGFDPESLKVI